jgi:hypothetical protein
MPGGAPGLFLPGQDGSLYPVERGHRVPLTDIESWFPTTFAPGSSGTYRALSRYTGGRVLKLDQTRQLILQANALVWETRRAVEAARKAIERKDTCHRADPRALAETLSNFESLTNGGQLKPARSVDEI